MNINILRQFRHDVYDSFPKAKDALFNTVDALMSEPQAKSLPEVTQSLWFERQWSSVYEALADGHIDQSALRKLFWRYVPQALPGHRLWIGIDVSGIARPSSVTAADRTALTVHNLPKGTKAITYGWHFSTMVVLSEQPSCRTFILDQQRVKSDTTATQVAVEQLRQVATQLPARSIVVLDRGYDASLSVVPVEWPGYGSPGAFEAKAAFLSTSSAAFAQTGSSLQRRSTLANWQPSYLWNP